MDNAWMGIRRQGEGHDSPCSHRELSKVRKLNHRCVGAAPPA